MTFDGMALYAEHVKYRDDPTALKCVGLCLRRLPRTHFREAPWHGRAAACKRCEGLTWAEEMWRKQQWEHEQTREKLRAYQRYAAHLKLRLLIEAIPRTTDVLRAQEKPFHDAMERSAARWGAAFSAAVQHTTELQAEDHT